MAEKEKKNFVLMDQGKDTAVVFSNAQPRGAALKAAKRGHTSIRLRERGTKRVHVFEGKRGAMTPRDLFRWAGRASVAQSYGGTFSSCGRSPASGTGLRGHLWSGVFITGC